MTYSPNNIESFALPLPITQTARRTARQFASQQGTPQKAEQVRLNTLAVYAVNDYLQMIGIHTDISAGDSWNPVVRLCADVADLEVRGVGRLECRPLRTPEQTSHIPPEVWSDRIGYVMVQIDESQLQVNILGFAPTAADIPVSHLSPLEDLIAHLHQLMQPVGIVLSQWLDNVFETGWQNVEVLLASSSSVAFRSEIDAFVPNTWISKAKFIDLGIQLAGHPVALIVEVRPESEQKTSILLQVRPTGSGAYLPPRLQLIVLDGAGETFLEAQARSTDDYIQLEFSGSLGEQFSIKVALGDASTTEDFTI